MLGNLSNNSGKLNENSTSVRWVNKYFSEAGCGYLCQLSAILCAVNSQFSFLNHNNGYVLRNVLVLLINEDYNRNLLTL